MDLELLETIISFLSYSSLRCFLCTYDIYCTSVRPGRGIPSSVSLPEVSSIFSLLRVFWEFFLIRCKGLRAEGVVYCTDCDVKPPEANL